MQIHKYLQKYSHMYKNIYIRTHTHIKAYIYNYIRVLCARSFKNPIFKIFTLCNLHVTRQSTVNTVVDQSTSENISFENYEPEGTEHMSLEEHLGKSLKRQRCLFLVIVLK